MRAEASTAMPAPKESDLDLALTLSEKPPTPIYNRRDKIVNLHLAIDKAVTAAPPDSALKLLNGLTLDQTRSLFAIANQRRITYPGSRITNDAIVQLCADRDDIPWFALWYVIFHDFCVKMGAITYERAKIQYSSSSKH
ncbi:hypothetical protein Plhal703r1_c14g0068981 [Plasmopara halstedii]